MSGTELIMGMGEVINNLKDLEAENKKLKDLCADPKSVEHNNAVSNMILDNITYENYLKMK